MKKIFFITTSNYKFEIFTQHVQIEGFEFEQISIETPEIQAKDNKEVAEFSAKWAADKFNVPVLKEDIGLYIDALSGFPGPFLNQIEKWIGAEGFLSLIENNDNRSAAWEFCIAYCEPQKTPISFSTFPKGKIGLRKSGSGGWTADKLFVPENSTKTIAELIDDGTFVRNNTHYLELKTYLENNHLK